MKRLLIILVWLPVLAFGYFNQGERETKWSNRFRFGITLPLWFGQYKSHINAAKTEQQVLQNKQEGLQQELSLQALNTGSEIRANWQSIQYYQQTARLIWFLRYLIILPF